MTPRNVSKELDWLLAQRTGKLSELDPKEDNSALEFGIEQEYQSRRQLILIKYGYTYQDASV